MQLASDSSFFERQHGKANILSKTTQLYTPKQPSTMLDSWSAPLSSYHNGTSNPYDGQDKGSRECDAHPCESSLVKCGGKVVGLIPLYNVFEPLNGLEG